VLEEIKQGSSIQTFDCWKY